MRCSGFVLTGESGEVLGVSVGGAGDLVKSHVKGYVRKDGVQVKEHDDKRQAHPVGTKVRVTANQHPDFGKEGVIVRHAGHGIGGADVPAYSVRGVDGPVGHGEVEKVEGGADDHPNVVGKADFGKDHPEKGATMKFAGRDYHATGKSGQSLHDKTPVREFEHEDGHRVWADGAGRVHADSSDEVAKLRQAHEAAAGDSEEKPKAKKPDASPHGDANESGWDSLKDEENPRYALQSIGSAALGAAAKGKDDLNRRAKVELAARGLDSNAKWVGFKEAAKHHGVDDAEFNGEPDEVAGHLQNTHSAVLSAAARGDLDLNKQAKHELANRGHDSSGKWIGFAAAAKHHGVDATKKAGGRSAEKPMSKALLFVAPENASKVLGMIPNGDG